MTTATQNIANEMIEQLGNKVRCMIGAKMFLALENGLQFRIGKNCKKVNCIKMELNALDLYDITYYNIRGMKVKTIAISNNIYADMMHADIEENTGMRTSL